MNKPKVVGIDLGTTYSCVGVIQNGKCEIISNDLGERTTPSVVGFIDGERYVGKYPKDQMHDFPLHVITCAKRLIGRKFVDPNVQKDIEHLPFKIVSKDGNAAIEVKVDGKTKIYTPEEISAMVLLDLKQTAVSFLGGESNDTVGAVITIPAYFNDSERQATIDAAKIAGLNVLRIINEPTAAALAYGYKQKWKEGIILVYDLGGGTFDVSLIKITNNTCEVLAVDGDDHLGGEDFDNLLVKHCIAVFLKLHKIDISNNDRAISRLKAACEEAKRLLSNKEFATIEIDELFGNIDFKYQITQARFNELCKELVEKTLGPVKNVLEIAKLEKKDITNVLLVGGSTRIPYIRKRLFEFFDQKNLNFDINPDEAVANGATLLAAHLSKQFDTSIQNIRLLDVIPRSLGIRTIDGSIMNIFSVVIKRFTQFPCEITEEFEAISSRAGIKVYEGEDPAADKNRLLGSFTLRNIAPAPVGRPKLDVIFKIDENCILTVTAVDKQNGNKDSIEILPDKGRLPEAQIVKMIDEICSPIKMEIDEN
uniref:Heat shock protein 70 n=1 Tax=Panagrolaimus davidi TaxID=227884 RepID=A0A914PSE1_9BILA